MIYLDMDGVCVDPVIPALKLNNLDIKLWTKGQWELVDALEFTEEFKWSEDQNWWANLPPTPWFVDLFTMLMSYDRVVFLTYAINPAAAAGKLIWIQRHIGSYFLDYVLTARKWLLAGNYNDILIDDRQKSCIDFENRGSKAIIFPGRGNYQVIPDNIVEFIEQKLQELRA